MYNRRVRYACGFIALLMITTDFFSQIYNTTLSARDKAGLEQKKAELEEECKKLQATVKKLRNEDPELIEYLARGMGYVRDGELVKYSSE